MENSFRTPLDSLEYFALLVADEEKLPLAEAAANIAQIEYPDLSLFNVANDLDQLTQRVKRSIADTTPALNKIALLNELLYKEMHFRSGNYRSHEDIDLFCINFVLETRRGSDVMLAIIYLEAAQAIGLQARGVLFPEQLLIKIRLTRPNGGPAEVIIDPLKGESLNMNDINRLLKPFKKERGLVDEYEMPSDLFLEAATTKDIVAAILSRLRTGYQTQQEWAELIQVLDRLIILQPNHIDNYRERGYALIKYGRPQQAIIDLEHYLQHARTQLVNDAEMVEQQLAMLRDSSL